jgi:hypothetical protein
MSTSSIPTGLEITIEQASPLDSGVSIALENQSQKKVFEIFTRLIKDGNGISSLPEDKKRKILDKIQAMNITIKDTSSDCHKKIILVMMTAFKILEKAKPEEFDKTCDSLKSGFYYFHPKSEQSFVKQDFSVTFYSAKAASPAEKELSFDIQMGKKTIQALFDKVQALETPTEGGVGIELVRGFPEHIINAYFADTTNETKKAQFNQYVDCLAEGVTTISNAQAAKSHIKALKDKKMEDIPGSLLAVLGLMGETPLTLPGDQKEKAKALLKLIHDKIFAKQAASA